MKKLIRKKNNKGFSLVELIVVIAIMAVLVGILAPSLLRYVEKSRIQKDISAVSEVEQAVKVACADETVNSAVAATSATGQTITIAMTSGSYTLATTGASKELEIEVAKTIPSIKLSSNALKGKSIAVKATVDSTGSVTVAVSTTGLTSGSDAETAWTTAGYTNSAN